MAEKYWPWKAWNASTKGGPLINAPRVQVQLYYETRHQAEAGVPVSAKDVNWSNIVGNPVVAYRCVREPVVTTEQVTLTFRGRYHYRNVEVIDGVPQSLNIKLE